jgi:hypothetical protein
MKNSIKFSLITLIATCSTTQTAFRAIKQIIKFPFQVGATAAIYDYGATESITNEQVALHEAAHAVVGETVTPGSTSQAGLITIHNFTVAGYVMSNDLPEEALLGNMPSAYAGMIQDFDHSNNFWSHKRHLEHELGLPRALHPKSTQEKLDCMKEKSVYVGDVIGANTILSSIKDSTDQTLEEQKAFELSAKIIASKQKEIRAVAQALESKKTLTGYEIRAIIANAGQDK